MQDYEEGHPRRWWILVAICAALLIVVVDNTVLSVALPAIAEDLGAGTALLQAIVDAYVVVFAGLLVAAGAAADRYGRRRVLLLGLAVFALASAAAGLAGSAWVLVGARAVMGVGAAMVLPATLAVLLHVFPARERPAALGAWAAVAAVAMAGGPVLGGYLVSVWSWAGVFWINVVLAAVALVAVAVLVPESRDPRPGRIDVPSAVLVTAAMSGIVLAVLLLGEGRAPWVAAAAGVVALAGLGWFVRRQLRVPVPLVDLALYRNPRFAGGSAATALLTLGTGSALFVLTQHLQLVLGWSALVAGAALAPLALGVAAGSVPGSRLAGRLGPRLCVGAGFGAVAAGFAVLATVHADGGYLPVAVGLALLGLGVGFSGPSVTSTVLGAVPPHRSGMGAALNDAHQQVGVAFGVAVIGAVLAARYRAELVAATGRGDGSLAETLLRSGTDHDPGLAGVARDAFVSAQSTTMLIAAGCAVAGAVVAALTLRPSRALADRQTDG